MNIEFLRFRAARALDLESLPERLTPMQIAMLATGVFRIVIPVIRLISSQSQEPLIEDPAIRNASRYRAEIAGYIMNACRSGALPYQPVAGAPVLARDGGLMDFNTGKPRPMYTGGRWPDELLVHVADYVGWAEKPPIPEGEAGELLRAWLSLAPKAAVPGTLESASGAVTREPRRRTDRLAESIEEAFRDLRRNLGREPTDSELYERLRPGRDGTGTVEDENDAGLIWTDTQGKQHTTSRNALARRFARGRRR